MSTDNYDTRGASPEPSQPLTANELDELIWDVAVGRPTRVVLDTARKQAMFFAVQVKIREAVARSRASGTPG